MCSKRRTPGTGRANVGIRFRTTSRKRPCAFSPYRLLQNPWRDSGPRSRAYRLGKRVLVTHIAIDGPAGSGKTTVARAVARRLGMLYLDTGAMYRALTWLALRYGVELDDEGGLLALLKAEPIHVEADNEDNSGFRIFIGTATPSAELHLPDVTAAVSTVAAHAAIRAELVALQRAIAAREPVVMAGRDIGTVVLPNAQCKIFLTASLEARAARRGAELEANGLTVDPQEMRRAIAARDLRDTARAASPLVAAPGAVVIDSSSLRVDEVVARVVACAGATKP